MLLGAKTMTDDTVKIIKVKVPGVQGPRYVPNRRNVTTPGDITVTLSDDAIGVSNNAAAAVNVYLLDATDPLNINDLCVKDMLGYAGNNPINLIPSINGQTIDGQPSIQIKSAYGAYTIFPINGNYSVKS